jgi:hypothetical protein
MSLNKNLLLLVLATGFLSACASQKKPEPYVYGLPPALREVFRGGELNHLQNASNKTKRAVVGVSINGEAVSAGEPGVFMEDGTYTLLDEEASSPLMTEEEWYKFRNGNKENWDRGMGYNVYVRAWKNNQNPNFGMKQEEYGPSPYDRVSHTCVSTPIFWKGEYLRTTVRCF